MNPNQEASKNSFIKVAIVAIPAILIVSICIALYLGATEEQAPNKPIEGEVTVPELADYLQKLNRVVGERGFGSAEGIKGLRQSAAMIQGTLGPENLGYAILNQQSDSAEGLLWRTIWINSGESEEGQPLVVIAVPYGESGTPLAFALGFAEFLTSHPTKARVRLVFYPPLPGEGELRAWISARTGDDGESADFIVIKGDGPQREWARVKPTQNQREMIAELVGKKGWEGNVLVDESDAPDLTFFMGEEATSSHENHAQRLLKMMPLVKAVIDQLAE